MKRGHIWIILLCLTCNASAQDTSAIKDGLKASLKHLYSQPDSTIIACERWLEQSGSLGYKRGQVDALRFTGIAHDVKGDYPQAMFFLEQAQSMALELNDPELNGNILMNKGIVSYHINDLDNALEYYLQSIELLRSTSSHTQLSAALNNLAVIYNTTMLHRSAITVYQEALSLAESGADTSRMASAYLNLAGAYENLDEHDSAEYFAQKAVLLNELQHNNWALASGYQTLAVICLHTERYVESKDYAQKAVRIHKKFNHFAELAATFGALADVSMAALNYQQADLFLDTAMYYGKLAGNKRSIASTWRKRATAFDAQGKYQEAANARSNLVELMDSIAMERVESQLIALQVNEQAHQFKVDLAKARNLEQQLKFDAERQRLLLISLSAGLIMFLVILIILWVSFRRKSQYATHLAEKNDQLRGSVKTQRKMITVLGHDLRSPLASILALLNYLDDPDIDQALRSNLLGEVKSNIEAATRNVDNLLHWVSNQLKQVHVNPQPVSLQECVNEAVSLHELALRQKNVKVVSNGLEEKCALFDKDHLGIIVRNLLHNAIKYSHSGKTIQIECKDVSGHPVLSVKDQGVGMTTKQVQDLYDRMGNTESGTTGEKGSGIGMKLVFEYLSLNQGTLHIQSEPGAGTTFTLHLLRG